MFNIKQLRGSGGSGPLNIIKLIDVKTQKISDDRSDNRRGSAILLIGARGAAKGRSLRLLNQSIDGSRRRNHCGSIIDPTWIIGSNQ